MKAVDGYLVEEFLEPLREGQPGPETSFDEDRGLNVLPNGRALVDLALDGGTVTGTKAFGERDDADRDDEPTTLTMVQAEGFDHAAEAGLGWPGTVTLTEATGEASDADDDDQISATGHASSSEAARASILGTITHTSVEAESSDVD